MAYFRHFFSVDPAYAGMNLAALSVVSALASGPRVCGDEPYVDSTLANSYQWTAYAGMIPTTLTTGTASPRGPCVCGDDPNFYDMQDIAYK